jgi:hypothetical protein
MDIVEQTRKSIAAWDKQTGYKDDRTTQEKDAEFQAFKRKMEKRRALKKRDEEYAKKRKEELSKMNDQQWLKRYFDLRKKGYGHSISEQIEYNGARSKKGTKNRHGKPLSDFRRGQYLGKAKGMATMVKMYKSHKNEN